MKINTAITILTKIKGISKRVFTAKNGKETVIVIVHTEAGNFSNYENIWMKQKIDLEAINEDDLVEITYTTYFDAAHNHEYKNFVSVRKAVCGKPDDTELKALAGRHI